MKIFKYHLGNCDEAIIPMPKGASVVCAQVQHGVPQIWAMVDPDACLDEPRRFVTVGTGQEFSSDNLRYIDTYQMCGGDFVFHVFEDISCGRKVGDNG